MYQDIRPAILNALTHGELSLPEIADQIGEPQFAVRAELRAMRRELLVTDEFTAQIHGWKLTNRGIGFAGQHNQLRLT